MKFSESFFLFLDKLVTLKWSKNEQKWEQQQNDDCQNSKQNLTKVDKVFLQVGIIQNLIEKSAEKPAGFFL